MTHAGAVDDPRTTGGPTGPAAAAEAVRSRRELLDALRRNAVHLETAAVLDLRADRSASPSLAIVLRERAAQRRRTAGRLRADLAKEGVLAYRARHRPG